MTEQGATPEPETRWKIIGGSVTPGEYDEILRAIERAGYKTRSAFVREVVLERAREINQQRQTDRRSGEDRRSPFVGEQAAA